MTTINFNGKTYTLTTDAEPSNRVLPYPKNYHQVKMGEEYDFEMTAKAVDENGAPYLICWTFTEIKGEEKEGYDHFDFMDTKNICTIGIIVP